MSGRKRRRARSRPRSRTISLAQLTRERRPRAATAPAEQRPRTRGDCAAVQRPCPWVGCRHSLFLDVRPNGSIKFNFPDLEPWDMEHSCSLDVAEETRHEVNAESVYAMTLDDIGDRMNLTRERINQVSKSGLDEYEARLEPLVREISDGITRTEAATTAAARRAAEGREDPDDR